MKEMSGISPELKRGIERYQEWILSLGGYGAPLAVTMPDGIVREGVLTEAGYGGCQPAITTPSGKGYLIFPDAHIVRR